MGSTRLARQDGRSPLDKPPWRAPDLRHAKILLFSRVTLSRLTDGSDGLTTVGLRVYIKVRRRFTPTVANEKRISYLSTKTVRPYQVTTQNGDGLSHTAAMTASSRARWP
jgi:hypothetical protein